MIMQGNILSVSMPKLYSADDWLWHLFPSRLPLSTDSNYRLNVKMFLKATGKIACCGFLKSLIYSSFVISVFFFF